MYLMFLALDPFNPQAAWDKTVQFTRLSMQLQKAITKKSLQAT